MVYKLDWFNCEKVMPPLNDFYENKKSRIVLIVFEDHWIELASYCLDVEDEYYFWTLDDDNSDPIELSQVSYWMPLPMPPKGWHESVEDE